MKITKNTYDELKLLHDDLIKFLTDLKYDQSEFRMVALEYSPADAKIEQLAYFDSRKNQIVKETLEGKNFGVYCDDKILTYLKADPETAVMESASPNPEINKGEKKPCFYVIFDFKDKVTMLLNDFLRRYQQHILHCFTGRGIPTVNDVMEMKQDVFNDAVKQYIDLDVVLTLAGSHYEQRDSLGSIIYVKNRRDAEYKIKFTREIDFNMDNLRLLRKLLEISDKSLSLIVYEKKIVGLGQKDTLYRKVQFNGHQNWTLHITQKESLRFARGKFFFDRGANQLVTSLPKGFILKKFEKPFNDIINILTRQKHGALLIITSQAKEEVERLSAFNRGYAISPIDFTAIDNLRLIKNLASVDGAVFITQELKCYGTGVILDGVAKRSGSSARGSRFNSAVCYLDNKTDAPYAAIVFSEDETVDVLLNTFAQSAFACPDKPAAPQPAAPVKTVTAKPAPAKKPTAPAVKPSPAAKPAPAKPVIMTKPALPGGRPPVKNPKK